LHNLHHKFSPVNNSLPLPVINFGKFKSTLETDKQEAYRHRLKRIKNTSQI